MNKLGHHSFTWDSYKESIVNFISGGYNFQKFSLDFPEHETIFLRHDIDFCLNSALRAAEIEKILGIKSNFFILIGSEFYNIISPVNKKILRDILAMGHNVGLHFDASIYSNKLHAIDKAAHEECSVLEDILSCEVDVISFHRPSKIFLGLDEPIGGRIHTYMPKFYSDLAYFSDSGGLFRFGHPLDSKMFKKRCSMQVLTHPIWWSDVIISDRLDLIDSMLSNRNNFLKMEAARNCIPYRERMLKLGTS